MRAHQRGGIEARLYVPKKLRHLYGGKRELSFYGRTEAEAIAKREAARRDLTERRGVSAQTFGAYLTRYLDTLAALGSVSERTLQDRRYYGGRYLIPHDMLGGVLLEDVNAEELDMLYARLMDAGVGVRSINHVHETARVALQRAVKKRLIPYNPARDADPPRYSTEEREYALIGEDDLESFFEAAKGDRFEALWITAILAGMRPHELRALLWEDLALPENGMGSAMVRRSAVELQGEPPKIRNSTKTKKPRHVPLLPEVVAALGAHRARQNEERLKLAGLWQDNNIVFPTTAGGVQARRNLTYRHFKPILKKAGLREDIRLYDLRHSFATLWNDDMKLLQTILGHARFETTANLYIHPNNQATSAAMERFGQRLRNQGS